MKCPECKNEFDASEFPKTFINGVQICDNCRKINEMGKDRTDKPLNLRLVDHTHLDDAQTLPYSTVDAKKLIQLLGVARQAADTLKKERSNYKRTLGAELQDVLNVIARVDE